MADQAPAHMEATAHVEQVRLLFDAKAATWPARYAPQARLAGRLTQLARAVGRHAGTGARVLDLGCGTGELARHLAAAGLRVSGCDISGRMLGRAAASDPARAVDWVKLDPGWRTLPFGPGSFDAVVAASVLEYTDSPGRVIRECGRMLRPGGALLFTVPDPAHPVRWLESVASAVARVPPIRAAATGWPMAGRYVTYLEVSRQRHGAGWWYAMAAQAGLTPLRQPDDTPARAPLRLFGFQRPPGPGVAR
jgi:SAM-dependent methyltransferase